MKKFNIEFYLIYNFNLKILITCPKFYMSIKFNNNKKKKKKIKIN